MKKMLVFKNDVACLATIHYLVVGKRESLPDDLYITSYNRDAVVQGG
ncbi:hypothetical protein M529_01170 [Sphingobium ummariense RL-3]|uniref:Uncharacterized protein n=1 Tax=Sphingobium ummariense RL-3 TaxID=1346791 RepID=T0KKU7_9SPHN|nr:hypothetical protein M529_01170 [Sphingobium ummariense RL-3]